jgi:RecB family endonuclease NucS
MPIPNAWDQFVKDYKADRHFQYFPHAHVGTERFAGFVTVLANFQGRQWTDAAVMAALRKAKLTSGKGAGARMARKATENLGFCSFSSHVLTMTPAGLAFIEDKAKRTELMERLLWRYQLSNPVNDGAKDFDLFPHLALLRILCALDDHRITRDEFILFVGRCRTAKDVPTTIKLIKAWRSLSIAEEDAVISALSKAEFSRRQTDSSYALGFHATASYLERFSDNRGRKGIRLKAKAVDEVRKKLEQSEGMDTVKFADAPDAIAYYGSSEKAADPLANLDHLLDTSQWDKAVAAFRKLPKPLRGGRTPKQFQAEVFLERDLENYLVKNMDKIEPGLKFKQKQYGIRTGVIDLLGIAKNGDLVVVELKKVRASDKVFGQLCRYLGYMAEHEKPAGKTVRGYIVGSEIDIRLQYAAKVAPIGIVSLKRFRRDANNRQIFIED